MALKYEPCSWQRICVSLALAAIAASISSVAFLAGDQIRLRMLENQNTVLKIQNDEIMKNAEAQRTENDRLEEILMVKEMEKNQTAIQAKTAVTAAKIGFGVVACTVLWDMTAFVGNPLAVPGLSDNAVCGAMAAAIGFWSNPFINDGNKTQKVGVKISEN